MWVLCAPLLGLYWLALSQRSAAEMYTAVDSVGWAIGLEAKLLGYLGAYLEEEILRINDLKRFYEKVQSIHANIYDRSTAAVANPLLAYTLIKRLHKEWKNVAHSTEAIDNVEALKNNYEKLKWQLPTFEDLEGAAKGLMRLQDVYSLNIKALVNGQFQRHAGNKAQVIYSPANPLTLSADDCFHIGKTAYDMQDYYHSLMWLEEAAYHFRQSYGSWRTEDQSSLEDALDYLAFSHFKTGNISHALALSKEFLHYDPTSWRIAKNIQQYEKLLGTTPLTVQDGAVVVKRPNVTNLLTRDSYESLCRTLGSQVTHYQDPKLYCSYETNDSPYLILQPIGKEIISLQPYAVMYHNFVNDWEADNIKKLASYGLQRSVVASGEKQEAVEYRISKSAWLKDTADPLIHKLDQRIAALTGLNVKPPYAEYLQVVNYGIGGHYEPHFDHATSAESPVYRLNSGNRVATFMIYLSSVQAGGSTAFIYANFSVPVVK
ncbi:prolyl 4-hydroxylase subunit alpha-3 isoform X2 [Protopterus annectens]|nr:prolyl 4-hydroxylase subunit alpha-3 isoform X2 [Protopterus annectens]